MLGAQQRVPGHPAAAKGRARAPTASLTLLRASGGGGGVPGPKGAQQRAHRRRPAGAPPAPAAHPAAGPLRPPPQGRPAPRGAGAAGGAGGEGARGWGCGRRGPAGRGGGGAATRGQPFRRAGARRGAAVTLISPDPSPRRRPRCGTSVPGTVCDVKGTASRGGAGLPRGEEAAWGRPGPSEPRAPGGTGLGRLEGGA